MEGEDEVLEVLVRHWEEFGGSTKECSGDGVVPDTVREM